MCIAVCVCVQGRRSVVQWVPAVTVAQYRFFFQFIESFSSLFVLFCFA